MGYLPSDKYNVAWFKLAECVARGEKERALGVYRLLSHTIDNQAFCRQLEGDIFLSCNDKAGACAKYMLAAQLYHEGGNARQAAALYEHILLLEPHNVPCLLMLIKMYAELSLNHKIFSSIERLLNSDVSDEDLLKAAQIIDELEVMLKVFPLEVHYQHLMHIFIRRAWTLHEVTPFLRKAIDCFMRSANTHALQQFIAQLQELQPAWGQYAMEYLKK